MTPTEIADLPAGRELDALVAERVLGCSVKWAERPYAKWPTCACRPDLGLPPHACDDTPARDELARYSTDWNAASEVIEGLRGKVLRFHASQYSERNWSVAVITTPDASQRLCRITASAETFPLAVCHAALAVIPSLEGIPL